MTADRPKALGDAATRTARLQQIHEAHISPLTALVEELRIEAGPGAGIPHFDPWDGGIEADILFLLEAPGPKAVMSGFISRDNPDETAKNFHELCLAAGLDRKRTVLWNAVPWYIGKGTRIRAATPKDLEAGLRPLPRLLALLPKLGAIVLVGKKAEMASGQINRVKYQVFTCPHPSPMFVNNAPGNRERILTVLRQVQQSVVRPSVGANVPQCHM